MIYDVTGDSIAIGVAQAAKPPPALVQAYPGIGSSFAARLIPPTRHRLIVSMGTNDDPRGSTRAFRRYMRKALDGRRCVAWLMIRRHPRFNAILRREAQRNHRLRLVSVRGVHTTDGIHPTAKGYAKLARRATKTLAP